MHLGADWIASVDIEDFFPSTNQKEISDALTALGYQTPASLDILSKLCSFRGRLSQGAPTSPVISNIALNRLDFMLVEIAKRYDAKFTRYADDIVFSGRGATPQGLVDGIKDVFIGASWVLSERKHHVAHLPQRLKVHGLLVHQQELRLTKGYRNKIRAYKHLQSTNKIAPHDMRRIIGHLNFATQIENSRRD